MARLSTGSFFFLLLLIGDGEVVEERDTRFMS